MKTATEQGFPARSIDDLSRRDLEIAFCYLVGRCPHHMLRALSLPGVNAPAELVAYLERQVEILGERP